ncbi:MAG: hypothetical protein CMJ58_00360 [Planctomycetaceae bacterium]|nr:hypothetical protein [Planctomycetaceae bacterium]
MPPPARRIHWQKIPLLCSADERASDRVVIDDALTLLMGGGVVLHDRYFRGNWLYLWGADPIDYEFPGGHAWRDRHSNRLVIRARGPHRHDLVFQHGPYGLIHEAWYQLVMRVI